MNRALYIAHETGLGHMDCAVVAIALCEDTSCGAHELLRASGIDAEAVAQALRALLPPASGAVNTGQLPFLPEAKELLQRSVEAAADCGHRALGTEHLLAGMLAVGSSSASRVLIDAGLEREALRGRLRKLETLDNETLPRDRAPWRQGDPRPPDRRDESSGGRSPNELIDVLDRAKEIAVAHQRFELAAQIRQFAYELRREAARDEGREPPAQ